MVVKAQGTDYGLGLEMKTTKEKSMKAGRAPVPLELEDMPLPLNTFKNKSPFIGTVKSVERIVGPNATGETCHIIICLLYTSPSPRDLSTSRMPSSA